MLTPAGAHVTTRLNHLLGHLNAEMSQPGSIVRVHWNNLSGVPDGFKDGMDNTGGSGGTPTDLACNGCVTSIDLGGITVRTASIFIEGGVGANAEFVQSNHVQRLCNAGEDAIGHGYYWDQDLNGAAPGGTDDLEVGASTEKFVQIGNQQGWELTGFNDSGVDITMTLQVICLTT